MLPQTDELYCMDCMALLSLLPDECVSLILTDPPYGISYQNHFAKQYHPILTGDSGINYSRFAEESYRILKENAHAYFFTRFDCYPYHFQCLQRAGFKVKNCLIVEKGTVGGIGDLRGSYANNAEWIIFCQKGRREFNRTTLMGNKKSGEVIRSGSGPMPKYKTRFNSCWFGEEYPKATYNSTWQKKHQIYHPTIKNVEFLSWLIELSSQPGEIVFDGFIGTGSTALAAIKNSRHYLGSEICPSYYEIAKRRIAGEPKTNTVRRDSQ